MPIIESPNAVRVESTIKTEWQIDVMYGQMVRVSIRAQPKLLAIAIKSSKRRMGGNYSLFDGRRK